jgi:hypothetical protein
VPWTFATDDRNLQQIFQRGVKDAYIPTQNFRIAGGQRVRLRPARAC